MNAAELQAFFPTDLTVPVRNGEVTTRAFFDAPDANVPDGTGGGNMVLQSEPSLGIAAGALGTLVDNETEVIIGAKGAAAVADDDPTYTVRQVIAVDDGELSRVIVAKGS